MTESAARGLGEFGLIEWIRQQAGPVKQLEQGIGDDCARQQLAADVELLTTTDLLIEGVHFHIEWTSMEQLGRKAAAVNLSDIAAMGGRPGALYLAVGRPATVTDEQMQQLVAGFLAETRACGGELAGGDCCSSPGPLFISVTAQGQVSRGLAVLRGGARPGDSIYVSGTLGDAALALQQLLAGDRPTDYLAARFHTPSPRVALGSWLAEQQLASAMLDLSDGLCGDLGHLLQASAVGAELELNALPLSRDFQQVMDHSAELIDLALAGGEDYELVFTSPAADLAERTDLPIAVTCIGRISATPGLRIRQPGGGLYQCRRGAYDHFAQS